MSQLTAGIYKARPTGEASVYENDKGNLILCIEMECEGEMLRYYNALATVENGLNTKVIENLKEIFHWDGTDFFWFVDHPEALTEIECDAVIEMRPGRDGNRMFPSIKYLNTTGNAELPQSGDRQSLLSKYASKFRAVAGGSPPPAKPKAPPAPAADPSDQLTVWARYCELGGTEDAWFETLKQAVPGVEQGDFTPAHWGQALKWVEQNMLSM
jgi:hypothetical protein